MSEVKGRGQLRDRIRCSFNLSIFSESGMSPCIPSVMPARESSIRYCACISFCTRWAKIRHTCKHDLVLADIFTDRVDYTHRTTAREVFHVKHGEYEIEDIFGKYTDD